MTRIETTNPMEYYETLDLEWGASETEVTKKWRKLSLIHHPDKAGPGPAAKMEAEEKMKELNNAKDKIMNLIHSRHPPVKGEQLTSTESRRKKDPDARTARPHRSRESRVAKLEEEFWVRMPSLIIKLEQFVDNLIPVDDPVAEKYPLKEIRTHLSFVQRELYSLPATRSRETVLRGIADLLSAVKKLRIWLCEGTQEAYRIESLWSLRYLMSLCGWCVYEGGTRNGGDKAMMDKWLILCLPELEKQWRLAFAGVSAEQLLEECDKARSAAEDGKQ